jgi:putative ABC transport system ATP-binding protein
VSLLALEHVSKRYREGQREQIVLDDVDVEVREGELVVLYGVRRSGKSTLLRTAAGIERPDSGKVRFKDKDLREGSGALGDGIGYVAKRLRAGEEQDVIAQVSAPLLARGVATAPAREQAHAALVRAGADRAAQALLHELSAGETLRVALARTLILSPALVVIDEPVAAVELGERDGILAQLRTLAGEGTAVLASTAEPSELAGAHRALTLAEGRLRGPTVPELATVVALRRSI